MKYFLIFLFTSWILIYVPVWGLHYRVTTNGEHTGYITAVEQNGIIFKTYRVYLKTDLQSSQEDAYCVVDPVIFSDLEKVSREKTQVSVGYLSWLFSGVKNCGRESAVITSVSFAKSL